MRIAELLQFEDVTPALSAESKEEVLGELASGIAARNPHLESEEVFRILLEREMLGSTGIGDGIAIPHGKLSKLERPVLSFGRSLNGVNFDALDGRKVFLFFLLLAPEGADGLHLKMLARISRILKDSAVRRELLAAPDAAAIVTILREQDERY
jgi:PTS system nitrogen regulatory IIA component